MKKLLDKFMSYHGLTLLNVYLIFNGETSSDDGRLALPRFLVPFEPGFSEILDEIMAIPMDGEVLAESLTTLLPFDHVSEEDDFFVLRNGDHIALNVPSRILKKRGAVVYFRGYDEEAAL